MEPDYPIIQVSQMKKSILILTLLASIVMTTTVFAQDTLDPAAESNYGAYLLQQGFLPDPFIISVASGGAIDASTTGAEGCVGFTTSQPDLTVDYEGAGEGLRIFFVGAGDTTLIVADPSGAFNCNDDGPNGTVDPVVDIISPAEGTYSIWIGSYTPEESVPGYLMFTEFSDSGPTSILTNIASFVTSFIEFEIDDSEAVEPTATPAS